MRHPLIKTALLVLCLVFAHSAGAADAMSKADQKILIDMAQANIAEIDAGKLALSKSQDQQVKSFAQQMVDDHGKALAAIQQLAQTKGVSLPETADNKHKAMAARLEKRSGGDFDRAYMAQAGVSDHSAVHAMLDRARAKAADPELKALVAQMLPTVSDHLKNAKQFGAKAGTAPVAGK
jgi:putative membrane protein